MQEGVYYGTIEEERMLSAEEMDIQRKRNKVYEYLCRMQEAREWMENIIQEKIPEEFEDALKDGVYLARLVKLFNPSLVSKIFIDPVLQYRHTDNINVFFEFIKSIGLPVVFLFDLVDLYEQKNIPKVIYCILALAHYLSKKKIAVKPGNLVGRAIFTDDQIIQKEKEINEAGISLPSFSSINSTMDKVYRNDKVSTSVNECLMNEDGSGVNSVCTQKSPLEISTYEDGYKVSNEDGDISIYSCEERVSAMHVIQSYIRTLLSKKVISELRGDEPVTIFSLRQMVHLLRGDEEKEEVIVEELNRMLNQLFIENAELEREVTTVENKISLLLRNKIQKRGVKSAEMRPYMKYKSLQRLFSKLQDEPSVLTTLIMGMRQREGEFFCSSKLLNLFGGAKTPREEYTYLRIIESLVHASISSNGTNKVLGGLALRSLVVAHGHTDMQSNIRNMMNESVDSLDIIRYILKNISTLPYAVRFYARCVSRSLNRQYTQKGVEVTKHTLATEVFLSLWEIFFSPIIVSPETVGLPAVQMNKPMLLDECNKVFDRIKSTPQMGLDTDEFNAVMSISDVESISEYYTMKYIASRPLNNMLCLSGDEINYVLGSLMNSSVPGDVKKMAEECHPIPFKLVFIVPGGISPYTQESAGVVEKRLCKWAVIKVLIHSAGKSLPDILQSKVYDMSNSKNSAYSLQNEKEIEECKDSIQKYSSKLFDLGLLQNKEECTEILQLAAHDMMHRVKASIARKREIKATEKAIYSLEKARELIEKRQKESNQYLTDITYKIMENSREYKQTAKALLLEGVVLRMYNWQPSQMDSIEIFFKSGASGGIVISVMVIGIRSASETISFADLLVQESFGETEITIESLGAVFCIPKLIGVINKKVLP
ncbi:Ras GTPase-activating-like protein IQGAP2/3 [Nematocida sp. AWRm78]|nr:Ras GTPase-activating-like protein IQGAP2/3 [Nematocida sp. AWRm79]KAI5184474.1 Ras GTPase-activating-like protein IQGAP2/3 [Nematocida sp. AWRm78]